MYQQVELTRYTLETDNPGQSTVMICWLDSERKLPVGTRLTLKRIPDVTWTVTLAFEPKLKHSPMTRWEVGGLE